MPSSFARSSSSNSGTETFISSGTAGTSIASSSVNSAIMPTIRSISTVNAPSAFDPVAERRVTAPILITSPPMAPPGITRLKRLP